ncbi:hypothetical protein BC829DRAFT_27212 [Chytridium lagenaria]|nr:hypothetical protein BC829DRAFT_27212 [Chytridium lagenaria]
MFERIGERMSLKMTQKPSISIKVPSVGPSDKVRLSLGVTMDNRMPVSYYVIFSEESSNVFLLERHPLAEKYTLHLSKVFFFQSQLEGQDVNEKVNIRHVCLSNRGALLLYATTSEDAFISFIDFNELSGATVHTNDFQPTKVLHSPEPKFLQAQHQLRKEAHSIQNVYAGDQQLVAIYSNKSKIIDVMRVEELACGSS